MAAKKSGYDFNMQMLWGIAKSAELALTNDELHALVEGETGKSSLKQLTQNEINAVCRLLLERKDLAAGKPLKERRTDSGGNHATVGLRHKIYALCGALGWNDNNMRIRAFAKELTGVSALEWMTVYQCNKVIEALKEMVKRGEQSAGMG